MPLDSSLIAMIVAGLVLAYLLGMVAHRLRLPPIIGYALAGVAVGQAGLSTDPLQLASVAQFGVILLMFGVGLKFSLKDVMAIRLLPAMGAIGQLAVATLLGTGLGLVLGWDVGSAMLFGLALSSASGVMLHQTLNYRATELEAARIATGWLAAQYLLVVLALIVISAFATLNGAPNAPYDPFASFFGRMLGTSIGTGGTLALTLVKMAAFIGFMMVVGLRVVPWVLNSTRRAGSRELGRLATLAIALGVAWGAAG
ncbi:MAG TPA: cation:proton antiporter, partial [Devosia sp.]|nr:cation:proton antiporter [Devosia sp.]